VYITEAGTSMDTWRVYGARGPELVKLRGRVRATSGDILLELVLAGVGIGYPVGFAAAAHLQDGRLVPVLPQWTGEEVPIYLLYPPGTQQEPKVRAFVEFAVERLGQHELWAGHEPTK
jgi:DNA-binding transcriptional LysR family regulator